jgi:hypothetical protein
MEVAVSKTLSEIDEALTMLRGQGIRVGVPVIQEGLGVIIPVDKYILRSVEILNLKRRGKLDLQGIEDYAKEIESRLKKRMKE